MCAKRARRDGQERRRRAEPDERPLTGHLPLPDVLVERGALHRSEAGLFDEVDALLGRGAIVVVREAQDVLLDEVCVSGRFSVRVRMRLAVSVWVSNA